ncbi:MAG: efflux RND transporter permease subunit [Candidatus Kapabacteria bacterium]|nr:efflux RND transporter permease subunit [Candidatus Kapabacteria bacterium]
MKILEYSVKNYQFTLIIFIMVIALGVTTIINMPRSEDPEINAPVFGVVVIYPGTSPKDMEQLIVNPLEAKYYSMENIKRVRTTINDGVAIITVEYKYGVDVNEKFQEVIRETNAMRNELPQDIYRIDIGKSSPSNVNVLQLAMISDNAPMDVLKKYVDKLKDELEKLPSLKNVKINGMPEKEIIIELKLNKIASMKIPLDAIVNSVQTESVNIPGGKIDVNNKTFNIKTSGNYQDVEDIRNTLIHSANGCNVYLRDVADVYFNYEKENHITRLNRHRSVFIVAAQKAGENINKTQKDYLSLIGRFKTTLPSNLSLILNFDQGDNVNRRLGGLGVDFIIAISLVILTLLPLGGRASLIVMISIPLSFAIGIVIMNLLGYNLNQLSIVGLVVSLGLLVDDSIVVVENIERWLREGFDRTAASIKATQQIGLAVIGCTVTLMIAFMPITFLPGPAGEFIRALPVAVMASVLASMVVSLTIIPFMSSRILKAHSNKEGNFFLRFLQRLIHLGYSRILDKGLRHPLITLVIAIIIFGGTFFLIPIIGFSLFPASEKPQFLIDITTPLQSNIDYTDKVAREIEDELKNIPEIKYFSVNVGKGNPQVYYNVIQESEREDFAQIFVQLHEEISPDRKLKLINKLRSKWTPYPGAKVEVKNFQQGTLVIAPVDVRIIGDNLDTLRNLALKVESVLKNTNGTIYVNNPLMNLKSDIRVDINKEKAINLGVPTIAIDKTVRLAIAGFEVGKLTDENGKNFPIKITKEKQQPVSFDVFNNLYVNNLKGSAIGLNQIATMKLESSPLSIKHYNKVRTVSVSAFVKEGMLVGNVNQAVDDALKAFNWPTGYNYQMAGEVESKEEAFGGFGSILILTFFLFIAVLILEFKTFKSTMVVLSVIPLGIIGAVIALFLTGNSLSFVAFIGLIALAGIEVKNTILLVDFTNQLREKGMTFEESIRKAGELRFLPIILTSMTAIGGLLPIALSANQLIAPLAIVLIGGLISSTLLSRVITPVIYKLLAPKVKVVNQEGI